MKIGNITKAATFKNFPHQSYKTTFFVTVLFDYFHERNMNRLFWGVTQK